MTDRISGRAARVCIVVVCLLALALSGCGEKETMPVVGNQPPEESIELVVADEYGVGGRDPAASRRMAESGMPRVTILSPPRYPYGYTTVCYRMYLEWEGYNPDGSGADLLYKYLVIPEDSLPGGSWAPDSTGRRPPLPPLDYEGGSNHQCPPIGVWSHWVPADCTYVTDIDLSAHAGTMEQLIVVVTARSQAGSLLGQIFYKSYNEDRNWRRCIALTTCDELHLHVQEQMLGVRSSARQTEYETEVAYIYEGTEVRFRFWSDEDPARGEIAGAFRYYLDDPGMPTWQSWTPVAPLRHAGYYPQWIARFPGDGIPLEPAVGQHEFVLEVQDVVGIVSRCEFHFEVLEGPLTQTQHRVLLVDDSRGAWMEPGYPYYEDEEDTLWADILEGYDYEVHDTGVNYTDDLPPSVPGLASTVIWIADYDIESPKTHLLEICGDLNNYLHSYVRTGGNLIIIGPDPIYAHAYWPDDELNPDQRPVFHTLDFSPRYEGIDSTWIYNFNWEVFGIRRMQMPAAPVEFSTLCPCEIGWDAIDLADSLGWHYWDGVLSTPFFVTEVRSDIDVRTLHGVVPLEGGVPQDPDCERWVAVYVPGDGSRGHAAYIGVNAWACEHDEIKATIGQLLDLFGE